MILAARVGALSEAWPPCTCHLHAAARASELSNTNSSKRPARRPQRGENRLVRVQYPHPELQVVLGRTPPSHVWRRKQTGKDGK